MGATDHPAFAETEMANTVSLNRHAPHASSMLADYEQAEFQAAKIRAIRDEYLRISELCRQHYMRGVRWGILCGACCAGLVGAAAIGYLLARHAL